MHLDQTFSQRCRRVMYLSVAGFAVVFASCSAKAQDISSMTPEQVKAATKSALAAQRALCNASPECKAASDAKKDAAARRRLARLLEQNAQAEAALPSSH